jgi:hypothetical protein
MKYSPIVDKRDTSFRLGLDKNIKRYTQEDAEKFGKVKANSTYTFNHMFLDIPAQYIETGTDSRATVRSRYESAKTTLQATLDIISVDTFDLVSDLIIQGSLRDSDKHLAKVGNLRILAENYANTPPALRNTWLWLNSHKLPYAHFKNESLGTLCVDLAEGKEINEACKSYNYKVDPVNYMKATTPITEKQRAEAAAFAVDNGYVESFDRRLALLKDVAVPEILHVNSERGVAPAVNVFDKLKPVVSSRHKKAEFANVEEVHIDKFMSDILPGCSAVEVFLTGAHEGNMVNLTTANQIDSKPIFKWDNNFSWTYNGNLEGKSAIKDAVKAAGGKVDGVLNFRLAWNEDKKGDDRSDMDLWATENGHSIGYSTIHRKDRSEFRPSPKCGYLDVDNTNPQGKLAVENITWEHISYMKAGDKFLMRVHQYGARDSKGFTAEIEFSGETYVYTFDKPLENKRWVEVAEVTFDGTDFSIRHILPEANGSIGGSKIYGLDTNTFHKVNLLCTSPNHWGENAVDNKHFFFMLEGCHNETPVRTFHNTNLKAELLGQHRKVMDVLGNQCTVKADAKGQLAGVGFNSTLRDEVIVRLSGSFKRVIKIKF